MQLNGHLSGPIRLLSCKLCCPQDPYLVPSGIKLYAPTPLAPMLRYDKVLQEAQQLLLSFMKPCLAVSFIQCAEVNFNNVSLHIQKELSQSVEGGAAALSWVKTLQCIRHDPYGPSLQVQEGV